MRSRSRPLSTARRRARLPVFASVLLASVWLVAAARAQTRILPLGDSITHGGQSHASWRYALWDSLRTGGYVVDFVGSQSAIFGGDPPNLSWYPDYLTTFDRDHEGHWGWRTDQIDAIVSSVAAATQPDVVLIHLGTNDVGQSGAAGVSNADVNLRSIVGRLRAERAGVRIVLAQVVPIGPGTSYAANAAHVPALNAVIATIAADSTRPGSPITVVDQNTGFDTATFMQSDGLHPNTSGEARLAAGWMSALRTFLSPGPPPPSDSIVVANASFELPPLADGALASGPGTIANWRFEATAATYSGIFDPPAGSYAEAAGDGTPIGADGQNVAFLFNNGGPSESVTLRQTMSAVVAPSSEYVLRVAIGRFLPGQPYAFSTWGGFRMEILAGDTVIASAANTVSPATGTFTDAELRVVTDTIPAVSLGRPLGVRFALGGTEAPRSTHFDRVRLTRRDLTLDAPPIPHARTWARAVPNPHGAAGSALRFSLSRAGDVKLTVLDAAGRRVHERRAHFVAGVRELPWDGRDAEGRAQPPGLYLARIETPDGVHVVRLVRLD